MANGIIICEANGSGKTTICMALAQALNYKHMNIEGATYTLRAER